MGERSLHDGAEGRPAAARRYAIAVLAVSAAVLVRWSLDPVLGIRGPYASFYLAVIVAGAAGGLGPGLVATVLGVLSAEWFFVEPRGAIAPFDALRATQLVAFLVGGALVSVVCEALRRARRRARAASAAQLAAQLDARRLQQLIRGVRGAAIVTLDVRGMITSANAGAELSFGHSERELVGRSLEILFTPEDRAAGVPAAELARARAGEAADERWQVRRDGTTLWAVGSLSAVHDERGELVGFVRVSRDETELRRAREELRRSEAELTAVLEATPLAVFVVDPAGAVLRTNPAARTLWGELPDTRGLAEYDRFVGYWPETGRRIEAHEWTMARALRAGQVIAGELIECVRFGDGRRWYGLNSAAPMRDANGKVLGGVTMTLDVTRQRLAEMERDRLLESERSARRHAEEASRMKDEFLANASHELRTPLGAILGWAALLLRHPEVRAIPQATTGLDVIDRNARAQARLIEDLLDLSRIVAGRMRVAPRPTELCEIAAAALDTVGTAISAKGVQLTTACERTGLVSVDPDRIQQVIWNLLSNAVKFTGRGDRISLALRRDGPDAVITVTDTGQGIDPEFLPFVFERFRMADGSATRRNGGLGLGLAIVRHLVELHGGSVRAESAGRGHGATFTVTLPVISGAAPQAPRERAEVGFDCPASIRGTRALVLCADAELRATIDALLRRCGLDVVTADAVDEALTLLRRPSAPIDVAIVDAAMPSAAADAFVRELRAVEASLHRRIPAMALTPHTRLEERAEALRAGYDVFVPKPVEPAELLTLLAALVDDHGRGASRGERVGRAAP